MTNLEPDKINSLSSEELRDSIKELQKKIDTLQNMQDKTWKQVSTILSSIPLGLAIVDEAGKIEATNTQLRQMFEFDSSGLYGKPITHILPELKTLGVDTAPRKASARPSSSKEFQAEISVNEIETPTGNRFCVHVKDISEKQKLLEYKMNLASMVSHDLRTPLTTMRAVLSSIADTTYGDISDDGKEAVGWALTSSDYMNSVLANILDTEKVDSKEFELDKAETSTGKVIQDSIELLRRYASELEIKIESNFTNDVFFADEAKVIRILVNLLSNAIKFSTPGNSVKIEGRIEGLYARFNVQDNGPGIPEDMQEAIFDRFQQNIKSNRSRKSGFGLGLAISRTFAEMHGGRLEVSSTIGKGSSFTLYIPLAN